MWRVSGALYKIAVEQIRGKGRLGDQSVDEMLLKILEY
jgi:hypothetical protein